MAEQAIAYALTTKERVKDRLSLGNTDIFDTLIDRLIAAVTDMIESYCGGRRFYRQTYTNEVYQILSGDQKYLATRNIPIASVSSLQYRAGLKSNPNWTDFNTDDWEIVGDGGSGLIRVYGLLEGINTIRISYTAGYLIDFANTGTSTHTLPFDLSDLAERLVTKLFKRRENEGKLSEAFEGGTVQWDDFLTDVDKDTIARYRRTPEFV